MSKEMAPNDARTIWQNQRKEETAMPVEELRLRAFTLQTKVRRNLIVTIVFGVVLLILSAFAIMRVPSTSPRVITVLLMALISLVVYRAYKAFTAPYTLPADSTADACLDFYRRELTAQHRAIAFTWWHSLPEIALLIVIIRMSLGAAFRYEVARILLPLFFGVLLLARYWKARKLKHELAALNVFEKESDS